MNTIPFPVIDLAATGRNIQRLREERGLTVRDLQGLFWLRRSPRPSTSGRKAKAFPR